MNILADQRSTVRAEEKKLIYTVRLGCGAGSGVSTSWFLHLFEHFRSFIPGRAGIFFTTRDPPTIALAHFTPRET
jgi:hypothetical protein